MDLLDTYKVDITIGQAVDAKGAVVPIPVDQPPYATLIGGIGGSSGYVKATLTLTSDGVTTYVGITGTITIGVTGAVSLILTIGTPEPA